MDLRGLRDTSVIAISIVAVTEMMAASEGIGRLIIESGQQLRTEQMLAGLVVACLVAITMALLLRLPLRLLRGRG